ncbi:NADH dehydrogenase [ubiquinone] iron-sulfur protein 5 [Sardina pilchardus]|uniref:NADH dehydrogenase [ubiquinone] iron-sulfur protein 5 n=1 Tax=Sardina pilchardus TaxID=27697 RepID=UPI002E164341
MPFVDVQGKLGIKVDQWLLAQSAPQPHKRPARCHAFEKEWIECAAGIGRIRAKTECKLELEDFHECIHRNKMSQRIFDIRQQRDKLVKEGKYTPPPHHSGKEEIRP